MNETFDSWKGFKDAGFGETANGQLRLGSGNCFCTVGHLQDELAVHFESGVSEFPPVDFKIPCWMEDMWQWAACFASCAVGTSADLNRLQQVLKDEMPEDLAALLDIGFDDLEQVAEDSPDEVETVEGSDDPDVGIGSELLVVRKRLESIRDNAWNQLQSATREHDLGRVKECTARAERATELLEKFGEIETFLDAESPATPEEEDDGVPHDDGEEVAGDIETEIESELDELEGTYEGDAEEDGCIPRENHVKTLSRKGHCTNFAVTFPDGMRIGEAKASATFAMAIEKLGAERVAALGFQVAGDPIVVHDQSNIKKMPQMVYEILDGWFVKTHSSTYTKMSLLRKIAVALKVNLKFELFRREPVPKPKKRRGPGRPPKPKPRDPNRFQIGRVVKHFFPKVFALGRVSPEEVSFLLSDESKRKFGTRGYPVLKLSTGKADEYIVNEQRRYYADIVLEAYGRKYLLTSQFITENSESVLAWLESKGFDRNEMKKVGQGEEVVPGLFKDITVFANDGAEEPKRDKPEFPPPRPEANDSAPSLFDNLDLFMPAVSKSLSQENPVAARDVRPKLRKLLRERFYTPTTIAQGLGVPRRIVKGWLKGRGVIPFEQLRALRDFLGVDMIDLGVGGN